MGRALLILESQKDKELAAYWIGKAPAGTRVEFKASKRTLPQNDLMWALLTEVAQQLNHGGQKYTPEQWKGIFLHAFGREVNFLPSLDLKTFLPIELSSSDLSKDEMTNFIEFIIKEGTDRGVVFHTPRASNTGDRPSTPVDDETQPPPVVSSSEPSDIANASGGSPNSNDADFGKWLLNVARMLWAATNPGGDLDVLKNQKKAALIEFPKPDGCPERVTAKAEAVYRRCIEVIEGSITKDDALAIIAGNVGAERADILRKAGT